MHLEFNLPRGAGGMAAGYRMRSLKERIRAWADEHNITVINWTNGYRCCFEFSRDSDYTLFALCWPVNSTWDEYMLVTE